MKLVEELGVGWMDRYSRKVGAALGEDPGWDKFLDRARRGFGRGRLSNFL